ncbi:hypothetical protein WJX82_001809 [Trebouxia sp. C0006]
MHLQMSKYDSTPVPDSPLIPFNSVHIFIVLLADVQRPGTLSLLPYGDKLGPGIDSKGNMRDHTQAGKDLCRLLTSHACTNWQAADALEKWFSELQQPALPSARSDEIKAGELADALPAAAALTERRSKAVAKLQELEGTEDKLTKLMLKQATLDSIALGALPESLTDSQREAAPTSFQDPTIQAITYTDQHRYSYVESADKQCDTAQKKGQAKLNGGAK